MKFFNKKKENPTNKTRIRLKENSEKKVNTLTIENLATIINLLNGKIVTVVSNRLNFSVEPSKVIMPPKCHLNNDNTAIIDGSGKIFELTYLENQKNNQSSVNAEISDVEKNPVVYYKSLMERRNNLKQEVDTLDNEIACLFKTFLTNYEALYQGAKEYNEAIKKIDFDYQLLAGNVPIEYGSKDFSYSFECMSDEVFEYGRFRQSLIAKLNAEKEEKISKVKESYENYKNTLEEMRKKADILKSIENKMQILESKDEIKQYLDSLNTTMIKKKKM